MNHSSGNGFDAIVALGSNMGDKAGNIRRAIAELDDGKDVKVVARSRDYRTAPWGITDQDWFVNAAVAVDTSLSPQALLERCLGVERTLGRVRSQKWGPRAIDLDVIVYRDVEMSTDDLVLPHPHMCDRAFVLRPIADFAPGLLVRGRSVAQWLASVPHDDIVPL